MRASEALLKGFSAGHKSVDRIGLVTVCNDCALRKSSNRSVDNEARILKLALVKSFCADSVAVLNKYAVTAVLTSAHNEIGDYGIGAVRCSAEHDSASGISG